MSVSLGMTADSAKEQNICSLMNMRKEIFTLIQFLSNASITNYVYNYTEEIPYWHPKNLGRCFCWTMIDTTKAPEWASYSQEGEVIKAIDRDWNR